ncbi:hypothetical protein [Tuberibacillus calidus]|jgi:hypothetical protein|nr:hypothetical protein [Tuberibacillus calidus]
MAFRVLIVDDEQPAREELAYMLGEIPDKYFGGDKNGMVTDVKYRGTKK